jgi:hypothetical protein
MMARRVPLAGTEPGRYPEAPDEVPCGAIMTKLIQQFQQKHLAPYDNLVEQQSRQPVGILELTLTIVLIVNEVQAFIFKRLLALGLVWPNAKFLRGFSSQISMNNADNCTQSQTPFAMRSLPISLDS